MTFEKVVSYVKLFTTTATYVSGLLDNFISAAPECDTAASAVVPTPPLTGAGEACMAASSGFKVTMVTVKTVFDTVSNACCRRVVSLFSLIKLFLILKLCGTGCWNFRSDCSSS